MPRYSPAFQKFSYPVGYPSTRLDIAFPKHPHFPAQLREPDFMLRIARDIAFQLQQPIIAIGLWAILQAGPACWCNHDAGYAAQPCLFSPRLQVPGNRWLRKRRRDDARRCEPRWIAMIARFR